MPANHIGRPPTPITDRFWSKVDVRSPWDCWEWTGPRNDLRGGYGTFTERRASGRRTWRAHRLAYELTFGGIPAGLVVRHACDNPPCVNPLHLLVGTQKQNLADMMLRGRHTARPHEACPEGHVYAEHGRFYPSGRKVCLICKRDRELTWWYANQGRERPPWSTSRAAKRAVA
jgi:hypothetical protein